MVVIVTIARLSPCTKIHHHHHHHHHHHDDDHRHRRHHDSILETSISVIITISRHLSSISTRRMAHRVLGSEPPAVVGSRFLDSSARRSGEMCALTCSTGFPSQQKLLPRIISVRPPRLGSLQSPISAPIELNAHLDCGCGRSHTREGHRIKHFEPP